MVADFIAPKMHLNRKRPSNVSGDGTSGSSIPKMGKQQNGQRIIKMHNGSDELDVPVGGTMLSSIEFRKLLRNKHIVVIGDSVQRGVYKDIVVLLQQNRLLTDHELKQKGELSHCGDYLSFRTDLTNSVDFIEVREWISDDKFNLVQFYFVTRCLNDRMEKILQGFEKETPDIIIMNSCLWDISRYFKESRHPDKIYYQKVNDLCSRLREILPVNCMLIWCSTLPLASKIVSGFLQENVKFLQETLRVSILEANYRVAQIVAHYGFDVLDLHYYLRAMIKYREDDGVHWQPIGHRYITELISTFLYDSWGLPLPPAFARRLQSVYQAGEQSLNIRHLQPSNHSPNFFAFQSKMAAATLQQKKEENDVDNYILQ